MTTNEMTRQTGLIRRTAAPDREARGVYCCDLPSHALAHAPAGSVWITVMGQGNTVAVALRRDVACVVLAAGAGFDDEALAAAEGRLLLCVSERPVFETARAVAAALGV